MPMQITQDGTIVFIVITMNMAEASFLAWQKKFSSEDDCLKYLQPINGQMVLFVLVVVMTIIMK